MYFRCINRNGGFQCICDDGFSGEDGTTCKDIDECTENPTLCENGICLNDQVHKGPFTNYVSTILQFFDQPTNLVSTFTKQGLLTKLAFD